MGEKPQLTVADLINAGLTRQQALAAYTFYGHMRQKLRYSDATDLTHDDGQMMVDLFQRAMKDKMDADAREKELADRMAGKPKDQPGVWCGECNLIAVEVGDYLCSGCRGDLYG